MDKELARLHDITRNMLIDVQRNLLAKKPVPGFSPSDLKKVRKALSNLDFDTESYGDIMEKNVNNPKGLMKAIRNQETRVMRAFELLPDDTIHHLVQQRTGGDFSLNVSGDTVRNAVSRLQDRFQMRFGQATGSTGTVRGDTAFSNFAHKADDRATGLEKLSGIGKNTDPSTTAHRYGTTGYSKTLTAAEIADADALVEALAPRITDQLEDVKVGIQTDSPRVEAIRALDPRLKDAYKATNTAEDIAEMKGVIQTIPRANIIQTYRSLPEFKGGSFRLSFLPGAEEMVQAIVKNPLGAAVGAASMIEPEAITSAFQGNYRQAAEQTAIGAGVGAGIQQVLKVNPVQQAKLASFASKIPGVASRIPAALKIGAGVAKFAPPVLVGVAGYQTLNAIVEGATGKNLQETGVAAEEKKEQLREEGYSDYELRRRARTGYRRP
tara:strand:- start:45 stop:1358 length:1314 start_codon:yes stop_codon:yes gene_type:complete